MYIALIADIINSRMIENRSEVQMKLNKMLASLNKRYKDDIAAGFTITIGDEFQGLLISPQRLMKIIDEIKVSMYPVTFRFGLGIGDVTTEINALAIGSDGPAFYNAREAINYIKEASGAYEQPNRDIAIISSVSKETCLETITMLNTLWINCCFIERCWTDKQRMIVHELIMTELTQRELAERFDLKQSSVQRRISGSGYYTYKYNKEEINKRLNQTWECINGA